MGNSSLPSDVYFIGLDLSTQSLKAAVIDHQLNIVASDVIYFASDLPHYKTKDGVIRDPSVKGRVVAPALMWVEALDLILKKITDKMDKLEIDISGVGAISGSGQQHGSVYWKTGYSEKLHNLDPDMPLVDQLEDCLALKESPIWMDSSTTEQCREIEEAVGGPMELAKVTGSRAYERFTGPQIQKIWQMQPEVYQNTQRISLVSSFMATLLMGQHACIDHSDGAGMNLMDIKERKWSEKCLEATAPDLLLKLGEVKPSYSDPEKLSSYFLKRYKFKDSTLACLWSGDNPNSLVGLTLSTAGDLAISLGTSDTVFAITDEFKPRLEGHVFPNPVDKTGYFVMLVYKNGSLMREDVRNSCAEQSWQVFNKYLDETPPLNDGKIGFYYRDDEILPPLPAGFHRYVLKNFTGDTMEGVLEHEVDEFDPAAEVRALIEGQFLSMRAHTERSGMPFPPKRIIATGGASANQSILNIISSIFGCDVYTYERTDSASLGAALRAAQTWLSQKTNQFVPMSAIYKDKLEESCLKLKLAAKAGEPELVSKYGLLMKKRMEIENRLVEKYGRL